MTMLVPSLLLTVKSPLFSVVPDTVNLAPTGMAERAPALAAVMRLLARLKLRLPRSVVSMVLMRRGGSGSR